MDPIALRALERIIAVVIGGVCIWLGQRLFLQIPEQKAGEGRIQFPGGISVYVARVGPGVFFALFGATLVAVSFYRGIEVQSSRLGPSATSAAAASASSASSGVAFERFEYRGAGGTIAAADAAARADARALRRKDFARLNNVSSALRRDLPEPDRQSLMASLADVKVALMESMWDDSADGWGDRAAFERWVLEGEPEPAPAALKAAIAYYRQGTPGRR